MKTTYIFVCIAFIILFQANISAAQDTNNIINASEIITLIESNEDINLEDKILIGEINLSEINLPVDKYGRKIVKSNIEAENITFTNKIDFSNAIFQKEVRFKKCDGYIFDFHNCVFFNIIDLRESEFWEINLTECVFESRALFSECIFRDSSFDNSIYNDVVIFDNTIFKMMYEISNVKFNSTSFAQSQLSGVKFENIEFGKYSNFDTTSFGFRPTFINVTFTGYFNMESPSVDDSLEFTNVTFLGEALFRGNYTTYTVFFEDVSFKDKLDMSQSEYSTFHFKDSKFNSSIDLTRTNYNRLYIDWDLIEDKLIFDSITYLDLRQNYNNIERYEDADDVYFEYKVALREQMNGLNKIKHLIMELLCGYGVRPLRPISTGFLLIFPLMLINYKELNGQILKYNYHNLSEAYWFSVATLTNSSYENDILQSKHKKLNTVMRFVGSLLIALFLVTLVNVIIRP